MRSRWSGWVTLYVGYFVLVVPSIGMAETIEMSIAHFNTEIVDITRVYQDLAAEIDQRYSEGDVNVSVYPFNRSVQNVVTGKADIHFVQAVNLAGEAALNKQGLAYVSEPVGKVAFSMFYRKDNIPFKRWVDSRYDSALQNDLVVILVASEIGFFPQLKNVQPTSCLKCGLQKVLKGRADAIIYSNMEVKSIMIQGGFSDIGFSFYQFFDLAMVYRLDDRGERLNRRLSEILREMRLDGSLDLAIKPVLDFQKVNFNESGYIQGG